MGSDRAPNSIGEFLLVYIEWRVLAYARGRCYRGVCEARIAPKPVMRRVWGKVSAEHGARE